MQVSSTSSQDPSSRPTVSRPMSPVFGRRRWRAVPRWPPARRLRRCGWALPAKPHETVPEPDFDCR
jgi:hypothetical protein